LENGQFYTASVLITQVTGIVFAECKYIMQELASYNVIQS